MRIAVLGSSGLVGSSLVPYLVKCGHDICRVSRTAEAGPRADLTIPAQVRAVLNLATPEVIVNLAAMTNVDECEQHPERAFAANEKIVENVAQWMREAGNNCHLIHLSTDQVYDGAGPHSEGHIAPKNQYAASKYAGERAASTVPSTVLRTNFFGPSRCNRRSSLSDWLFASLVEQKPITVFDDILFSPISLQSLVRLLRLAIEQPLPGVFNLGSSLGMSKADFAFTFAETLNLPVGCMRRGLSADVSLAAHRPKDMRMDSTRFEAAFGVRLPSLKEELSTMSTAYAHQAK